MCVRVLERKNVRESECVCVCVRERERDEFFCKALKASTGRRRRRQRRLFFRNIIIDHNFQDCEPSNDFESKEDKSNEFVPFSKRE